MRVIKKKTSDCKVDGVSNLSNSEFESFDPLVSNPFSYPSKECSTKHMTKIIKVQKQEVFLKLFNKSEEHLFKNEVRSYNLISKNGISVPKFIMGGVFHDNYFIIYEKLERNYSFYPGSHDNPLSLAEEFAKLHKITRRSAYLQYENHFNFINIIKGKVKKLYGEDISRVFEIDFPEDIGFFSFTHGDVHSSNIMIKNGDVYLIDFESFKFRDPSFDLGKIVLISIFMNNFEWYVKFINKYTNLTKPDFIRNLEFYLIFHFASFCEKLMNDQQSILPYTKIFMR